MPVLNDIPPAHDVLSSEYSGGYDYGYPGRGGAGFGGVPMRGSSSQSPGVPGSTSGWSEWNPANPTNSPFPPPTTPPGGSTPPGTTPPKDDIGRLGDLLKDLFSQSVSIPQAGDPTVIPTPTTTSSMIPIMLIAAGIGIVGYLIYKKKHGGAA